MMKVRLRRLVTGADFRHGIPWHVQQLRAERKLPSTMEPDECVLLVSRTQLSLAFVFPEMTFRSAQRERHAIAHYRVQLGESTPWNPLMLRNYAEQAGIEIAGIKRFEEHLDAQLRELRAEWKR